MTSPLLAALRPKPFRGDVVAAGVVVLTTLIVLLHVRFATAWPHGVHFADAAVCWAVVTTMAVLSPAEPGDRTPARPGDPGDARRSPRAYQSVLYLAGLVLAATTLIDLATVLGSAVDPGSTGPGVWIAGLLALHALAYAVRRGSAACTLVAALSASVALLALVQLVDDGAGATALRRVLLAIIAASALGAVALRDRHLRHGVALVNVAGLATLVLAATFGVRAATGPGDGSGWITLVLAVGFGLIGYSSIDRAPGPAYLGVANLLAFVGLAARDASDADPSVVGWPLALAVAAAALLIVGLRPTTPAPPPPDTDVPPAGPLPLR